MAKIVSREIRLKKHPVGMPRESDFELAEVPIAEPKEGEVLVHNIYMSVDPYMRGRMIDRESYTPPFKLGEPLSGGSVGQVVVSNLDMFQVGDYVLSMHGWREYFVSASAGLTKIDPTLAPIRAFLGTVGMTGMTAYVGLMDIGQPKKGETVFVSAAAGAVGSVVCQIAKIKGCRVVGSAGSEEKITWLINEAGVDAAFNYKKTENLISELRMHCPNGIDIYFENVGGQHLEAALQLMNNFGRIPVCGLISQYNAIKPQPGPYNLAYILTKRLTIKGFIISDHYDRLPHFFADMNQWIADGEMKWNETIIDGIENAPKAFIGLFKGENLGKMLVRLSPEPTG